MTRHTCTIDGYAFTWRGGEYIDVTLPGQAHPEHCINVWDYATGKPSIPHTCDALRTVAAAWFDVADTDNLAADADPRYGCGNDYRTTLDGPDWCPYCDDFAA